MRTFMRKNWERILFEDTVLSEMDKDILHKAIVFDFYRKHHGTKSFTDFYGFSFDSLGWFKIKYNEIKKELIRLGIYASVEVPHINF